MGGGSGCDKEGILYHSERQQTRGAISCVRGCVSVYYSLPLDADMTTASAVLQELALSLKA